MTNGYMVTFFKAHAVWLTTAAVGAVSFLTPAVNQYVGQHPQGTVMLATLWGIAAAWAKSPREAVK
jgi:hypothetical protein